MTEQSIPAGEVIKIDPEGRYILVFPMRLSDDELHRYRQTLDDWLEEDRNTPSFLLIDGGVQVIRMERDDKEKVGTKKIKTKGKKGEGKGKKTSAKTKVEEKGTKA